MASNPRPERPPQQPPPRDQQPSVKVAMAAAMLRRGRDPTRVAAVTGVPLALVHLIAEHLTPEPPPDTATAIGSAAEPPIQSAPGNHSDGFPGEDTPFSTEDRWNELIEQVRCQQLRQRHQIRIMRIVMICWTVNTILAAVAGLAHLPVLAAGVLILSPLVATVLIFAAFSAAHPFPPPDPPPHRRTRPPAP